MKMVLKFTLAVERITQTNGLLVSVYPPGEPVPAGVGSSFAGKYVTLLGSPISAHFEYSRTNTSLGSLGGFNGVVGIGQLCLHVKHGKDVIVVYYSYEILTEDVTVTFSSRILEGQVTAATLNGCPIGAKLSLTPSEGGRFYEARLRIRHC